MKHIVGLIPARGGSKGVPKKNIRLLGHKPLILWTIEETQKSKRINRLILSTESQEIADIAISADIEIPFLRPANLADDDTPMIEVIRHCINHLNKDTSYKTDAIVLLQPTAPFRKASEIDKAVDLFFEKRASSVVSVSKVPGHYNPEWQLVISPSDHLVTYSHKELKTLKARRQDLSDTYYRNGEIYVVDPKNITEDNNLYGNRVFPILTPGLINIDSIDDFHFAEFLMSTRGQNE
jgi:CMP-N-acetylneuraminic acid synthetase